MTASAAGGHVFTALATAGLLLAVTACAEDPEPEVPHITQPTGTPSLPPTPTHVPKTDGASAVPRVADTVADGLSVPWGIDFLPDGDAVVSERDTRRVLRIDTAGTVTEVGTIEAAEPAGEGGLLGVAASPDFDVDRALFFYTTTGSDNRVLRTTLVDDRLGQVEVVLDGIPQGFTHDGGRIAFGPDDFLYVSTGETGAPDLAQDPDSLGGKILRITADGEPAPGNPDPTSPVWTSGHRNVQGLAWDDRGRLWASEFGDSTWDELNLIEAGNNYGWPLVEGTGGAPEFTDPHLVWATSEASPSGLAWLDGHLWMAGLRGERVWRIGVRHGRAQASRGFLAGDHGRLRTVVTAPDGSLWVTTSNQDGRGAPRPGDDRILRLAVD